MRGSGKAAWATVYPAVPLLAGILLSNGWACGSGGDFENITQAYSDQNSQCEAASITLPAWLRTNVPPGAVIPPSPRYVGVGIDWSEAVRADSTLSRYVYAPEVTLDGKNLNKAKGSAIVSTHNVPVTAWGLRYTPDNPLAIGRHYVKVVVRDSEDHVFAFEWEFCVGANQL